MTEAQNTLDEIAEIEKAFAMFVQDGRGNFLATPDAYKYKKLYRALTIAKQLAPQNAALIKERDADKEQANFLNEQIQTYVQIVEDNNKDFAKMRQERDSLRDALHNAVRCIESGCSALEVRRIAKAALGRKGV